jgi:hypothetical protein
MSKIDKKFKEDKKRLLALKKDWDGEGGEPFKEKTINLAIKIAKKLHDNVKNKKYLPDLLPFQNGSVDIDFRTDKFECLISVGEDGDIGYYCDDHVCKKPCDNHEPENSIKGKNIQKLIEFINNLKEK